MAAVAPVEIEYLSGYLSLENSTLNTLIDAPTADLVSSFLEAVVAKAREHDELAADKLRVDIELENAIRNSEDLRAKLAKASKNVEDLSTKLNEQVQEAQKTVTELQSQLSEVKSSSSTSSSEVENLRARIASLESANRDTVAILELKTTANDTLAQDLQKQHQKGLELSQQITALHQSVQNANSAASSAKFREQSLQQELELSKRNNEWFENELKTKSAEALKYRKEKGARINDLQRRNEEANLNLESLQRTEQALRDRFAEAQTKAEDSLSKIQQLQEAAAQTEEGFRQELESARRLAELQEQQTDTHRNRLIEVTSALEKAREEAADEIGRAHQQVEAERQEREQSEQRIAELEGEIDRLEALVSSNVRASTPATPRAGLNGSLYGRAGSPAFGTPASVRSKSAITATQAIDELYKVKGQLATEKRRSERLATEMEEMMQGLEAKQPEIEELQAEHERLQQEVVEMSKFVDQTGKERDRAKKESRKAQSELSTAHAEAEILRQQLQDLSVQIKMLLCDLDARERGLESLNLSERANLERLARGEVTEEYFEGMTDTDKFISQRLVVFRSISDLQEKNQELLKVTRTLGAQMESEEAQAAKNEAAKDHEEVQTLQARIENYKDELQSTITRSESYIKERDMFRRMLQHRGQLPANSDLASMFGQSVDGNQNSVMSTIEPRENANNSTILRELQSQFDQYREEQSVDRRTMKQQTERLSLEKGSLQAEIAKINSQLAHANGRYEMLHANFTMLQNENVELQKRSGALSEAAAMQDIRTQQVAEDLVEAKGLVESMRNEIANLKAEKKLWKDIQERLSQDNEGLTNERSRLNAMIANQQTLQNERDLSESETRRRLQNQVESLEAELTTTKRKLSDEIEENKKAQLRKEYDSQQNQKRVDELATNLGQVREELVAAKTTRDHLQARVDELTIELKSAEERVQLLQPRPTPRPAIGESGEDSAIREQQVAVELSEVKRDLELARSELENAKSQTEQYKSISQASEEELQSLNATQDQYREEMDAIIEEREGQIRELQQRLEDISAELNNTNNEMTTVRNEQSERARLVEEEKAILEAEITRLKDEDERHATAAQFHQQDLRAQAAIATKAQQDYENELVKHAEAAKLVQTLRADYNELKTESAKLKAESESARVTLSQSEISWDERREQFEKELSELKTRRDEVNAQNKILHQQLESVGAQITALQQSRTSFADTSDAGSPAGDAVPDRTAEGLRELNVFLRREKEIVEVQYELKIQEAKRLQQQLEYTQSQLDESRLKLDQERRLHADGGRSSVAHKDLMEKLNELNLFRESSITLRNEARQAQSQLAEKTKRVEELMEQIQPLENKVREMEHIKETMEGEARLLQEDRDRWQKRTQDILSKYDRVDPVEMEKLKETIETLQAERELLTGGHQERVQTLETALENERASWQTSRSKLIEQAKERSRVLVKDKNDKIAERDVALQEKDELQQQLSSLQQQLESAIQEQQAARAQVVALQQELESVKTQRDQALAEAASSSISQSDPPESGVATQSVEAHNQQIAQLQKELEVVVQERQVLHEQIAELREQLANVTAERDAATAEATAARSQQASRNSDSAMDNDTEEGQIDEQSKTGVSDEEKQALEARIAAAEANATEQESKAKKIEEQMEATLKQRSEKMKTALNQKLAQLKEQSKTQMEAEYKLKLEQERAIWKAENATIPTSSQTSQLKADESAQATPATPSQTSGSDIPAALSSMTDSQVRDFISKNDTARAILRSNLKKLVDAETAKVKEEHERISAEKAAAVEKRIETALNEAQLKAEHDKSQAVIMAEKKSSLRINMMDNRSKKDTAFREVVKTAAETTPQKPVVEVYEIAKDAKPPAAALPAKPAISTPAPAPPAAPTNAPTGPATPSAQTKTSDAVSKPEVKSEAPKSSIPQAQSIPSNIPSANGVPTAPSQSRIPSMSGGSVGRGGGARGGRGSTSIYTRGAATGIGRGRGNGGGPGNGARGGGNMNAGAVPFSPGGQAGPGGGIKRPRDEIVQQGNGQKRPRGG